MREPTSVHTYARRAGVSVSLIRIVGGKRTGSEGGLLLSS